MLLGSVALRGIAIAAIAWRNDQAQHSFSTIFGDALYAIKESLWIPEHVYGSCDRAARLPGGVRQLLTCLLAGNVIVGVAVIAPNSGNVGTLIAQRHGCALRRLDQQRGPGGDDEPASGATTCP
jgi:hypothetical protein